MNIQIKGLIATAMYFALGLISYLLIGEFTIFTWADPWVYIYMAFWPFIWFWVFLIWALIIAGVCLLIYLLNDWWEYR